MVRMLVLSDNLHAEKDWLDIVMHGNVDLHDWIEYPNIPRLSDYEIVVLDMKIPDDNEYSDAFLGLADEVGTSLVSGGVMICLNYFTLPTPKLVYYNPKESDLKRSDVIVHDGTHRKEINYDWMQDRLLSRLGVAQTDAKAGKSFVLTSKDKEFAEYFKEVTEYHKTIENVSSVEDEEGNFLGYELCVDWQTSFDAKVIAIAKVTKKPIACTIDIVNGSLILLPQSQARPKTIISQLFVIGKSQFESNIERIEERPSPPEWLGEYKTKQELDLERKIEELSGELEKRQLEHKRFEKIDVLLYGTGTPLEVAVQTVLEEMGCSVEKLEKGATIDLRAQIDSMKFAIEITGVDDKIYKDSKKFAQILQYLPDKEENEKIVLLVNTYRHLNVQERADKENFTKTVVKIARDNNFCLMTAKDLYFMWGDFLDGESPKKMFEEIHSTRGQFRYK